MKPPLANHSLYLDSYWSSLLGEGKKGDLSCFMARQRTEKHMRGNKFLTHDYFDKISYAPLQSQNVCCHTWTAPGPIPCGGMGGTAVVKRASPRPASDSSLLSVGFSSPASIWLESIIVFRYYLLISAHTDALA